MRRLLAVALLAFGALLTPLAWTGCSGSSNAEKTITILWAKWAPADQLQKLCDDYTAKTGIKVVVDQKPWSDIGTVKNQEFTKQGSTYDLFIGDSQWIGQGVVGKHYVELTDIVVGNPDLKDVLPQALSSYAEYPKGSQKYYAVPCESDAMALVYRKDLFEDPKHIAGYDLFVKSQFRPNAGAPLDPNITKLEVPKTWDHLLLIARYFKEKGGVAGIVMPSNTGYDQATMSYECLLWSFGGDWGDQTRNTVTINSPESVAALKMLKALVDTSTAQGPNMDYGDVFATYAGGGSAMALDYFANFPNYASAASDKNPNYSAKSGYFNVPAGPKGRFTALGGQGMSINAHIDDGRKARAKEFAKWFSSLETQKKWASLGGYTAVKPILESDDFKKATAYNALFLEAFGMMKDFWNIPQYDQLLTAAQNNISEALQGKKAPEAALADIQATHEDVLKKSK